MRPASCPRLFEVEAMRDGRLGAAERASFERHLASCAACLRESRSLDVLAAGLREAPRRKAGEVDELRTRRERTRLLAAFDRGLLSSEQPAGRPRRLLGVTAVALLAVGLFLALRARPSSPTSPPTLTMPTTRASVAEVRAESAAVWSEQVTGQLDQVHLDEGTLWIHVDHARSAVQGRLVVLLPDGELEDIGTTFTVSAEKGHTARVAVQEGSVVLRVRGQRAVLIGPGETWSADAPASACASALPAPEARGSAAPEPGKAILPPVASAPNPSVAFRAAMAALNAGDNAGASAAFSGFLARNPGDPRAEDAAYLRVIALQRGGDAGRMKQAALDYLRRYPAGFRRAEMERLSR